MGVHNYMEAMITHDLIVYKIIFTREFGLDESEASDFARKIKVFNM